MGSTNKRLAHSHGEPLLNKFGKSIDSSAISEDGVCAMTSDDSSVMFWNVKERKLVSAQSHSGHARCFIAPDGERGVSACDDGVIRVWNIRTGRFIRNVPYKNEEFDYASDCWISRCGEVLVAAYSKRDDYNFVSEIVSFDCFDCEHNCMFINSKRRLNGNIWDICGSMEHNSVSFLERTSDGTVTLVALNVNNLNSSGLIKRLGTYDKSIGSLEVCSLSAATDCSTMVVACRNSLRMFDGYDSSSCYSLPYYTPPNDIMVCAINATGTVVVAKCEGDFFGVWNLETGARTHILASVNGSPRTCSISQNGLCLIAGYNDGEVRTFNLAERSGDNEMSAVGNCEDAVEYNAEAGDKNIFMQSIVAILKALLDEELSLPEKVDFLELFINLMMNSKEGQYKICLKDR